jgi:DNA repair protein RadC
MNLPAETKPHHTGHRQRLRERLLSHGAATLPDYELLEVLLFAAKPLGDVKPIAKALLKEFGTLGKVLHAEPAALMQVKGVSETAASAIAVAKEIAVRLLREEVREKPIIKSWTALLDYCRMSMGHLKHEEFHVLYLNSKLALIADETSAKGTVDQTPIYPREVMKRALELSATSIILLHNHPSGEAMPSKEDIALTQEVVKAAKPLGIEVQDHLIITASDHFSFKAHGLMAC